MRYLGLVALALLFGAVTMFVVSSTSSSEEEPALVTEKIEYRDGDVVLEGWLAFDASAEGKRPGVLVVHEWWGLGDHSKRRAEELAKLGYVAFALDMYGKGKLTDDPAEAGKWASAYRGENRDAARRRASVGLAVLSGHERVDAERLAAIGFCFGGTVALELAWSGADLDGVVSFHGDPTHPRSSEAEGVRSAVLVCHGADDPLVPAAALRAFEDSVRAAKLDWQLIQYGGAVHAFTNRAADDRGIPGVGYDEKADRRSWEHMRSFLGEVFGR
jgi:dienelactone hydrolase